MAHFMWYHFTAIQITLTQRPTVPLRCGWRGHNPYLRRGNLVKKANVFLTHIPTQEATIVRLETSWKIVHRVCIIVNNIFGQNEKITLPLKMNGEPRQGTK